MHAEGTLTVVCDNEIVADIAQVKLDEALGNPTAAVVGYERIGINFEVEVYLPLPLPEPPPAEPTP